VFVDVPARGIWHRLRRSASRFRWTLFYSAGW